MEASLASGVELRGISPAMVLHRSGRHHRAGVTAEYAQQLVNCKGLLRQVPRLSHRTLPVQVVSVCATTVVGALLLAGRARDALASLIALAAPWTADSSESCLATLQATTALHVAARCGVAQSLRTVAYMDAAVALMSPASLRAQCSGLVDASYGVADTTSGLTAAATSPHGGATSPARSRPGGLHLDATAESGSASASTSHAVDGTVSSWEHSFRAWTARGGASKVARAVCHCVETARSEKALELGCAMLDGSADVVPTGEALLSATLSSHWLMHSASPSPHADDRIDHDDDVTDHAGPSCSSAASAHAWHDRVAARSAGRSAVSDLLGSATAREIASHAPPARAHAIFVLSAGNQRVLHATLLQQKQKQKQLSSPDDDEASRNSPDHHHDDHSDDEEGEHWRAAVVAGARVVIVRDVTWDGARPALQSAPSRRDVEAAWRESLSQAVLGSV